MRYRILGGLTVEAAGITAARDRTVLALLLLHPNRLVPVDDLIDAVWDTEPPATARGQLQTCVSRLRRALPAGAIRTDPAGYAVQVAAGDLDATRFAELVVAGDFAQALELWRGPALAGIDSPVIRRHAAALDERYAATVEDRVDQQLRDGQERVLVAELSTLVERYPLRERLRGQLMLALARTGRRADALAEFRRARTLLRDELGIEPGADLQNLHRRILDDAVPAAAGGVTPVRGLPRTVGDFTGRAGVVRTLREQLDAAPSGPVVQVIDGMAGVGKTTLAVHLAGLVGDRYPDAHLFIDLNGHSDGRAADPADAVVTLLRQLGVPPERIPIAPAERIALWRSELAGRRVLVVLDNAATSAQVAPLLPGRGANHTQVTSRTRLTGLDGVRPEPLSVLTEPEAVELFTQIVGDRARDEPEAAAEVVRRCGRLPLAVRLAGARLARRRRWRVADLVRRLGEAALPELASEDRTVSAAFALSYSQLTDRQQRLFRVLGLYPGERFAVGAAAALGDLPRDDAEDLLDSLVDVNLVEEPEPGRYRLHDLVREYAAVLAQGDPPAERRDAQLRLLNHATHFTAALSRPLEHPSSRGNLPLDPPWRPDLLPGPDVEPLSWMDRERNNAMAVLRLADRLGARQQVWELARSGWRLWYFRGYYDDLIEAMERGLVAARAAGDVRAAALMANYLASGASRIGRHRDALDLLELAEQGFRTVGDDAAIDVVLSNVAAVQWMLGDLDASVQAATRSLAGARRRQRPAAMVPAMNELGNVADRRGDLRAALNWFRHGLFLAIDIGSNTFRYLAVSNLSIVRLRLGHPRAERMVRLAIALNTRVGTRSNVIEGRSALGAYYRGLGRFEEAVEEHRAALDLANVLTEKRLNALARIEFALTLAAIGDRAGAAAMFRAAAGLAREIEARYEEARGLAGLATILVDEDPDTARRHAERALTMFRAMNVPEQDDVAKWLAAR
jgi:DNA-binding SARP family transcriptional activator/tetratricopeptide (TPR) repeat protein